MTRILGIDVGTNSLGWAVVDRQDDSDQHTLVRKGSYTFQEGVKIEKGKESSKASERTLYRLKRRQYFRRRLRKIEVLKVLVRYGWCPYLSDEALHDWHVRKVYPLDREFMLWQRTDEADGKNPYVYRHRCLHESLDLTLEADRYTLGRALYHLAQRRGFLSNRLDQDEEQDKTGAVKDGISKLSDDMAAMGCEYLGDYFYQLYAEHGNRVRLRCRYTSREEHYRREFDAICRRQQLSEAQVRELARALYFQRPLKSQRQSVGRCKFEPKRARCADSHPLFERFRMLQFLNGVRVQGPADTALRPLTDEERAKVEPLFYRKSKPQFDFKDIAKKIAGRKGTCQYVKDPGNSLYKFNYSMTQGVAGCPTTTQLRAIFGPDYVEAIDARYQQGTAKTPSEKVHDVWNVLQSFSSAACLRRWAVDKLHLSAEDAERFSAIRLSRNFARLSLAAIRRILPWLEQKMIFSHAVFMAKIPDIVGHATWQAYAPTITAALAPLFADDRPKMSSRDMRLEDCIKDYLTNNFELRPGAADSLYHPSMLKPYPDARPGANGLVLLGSPRTDAVRNPMAMRSLHQLRRVVNALLTDRTINADTEVHIEYARELNNANKRAAISKDNKDRKIKHQTCVKKIAELYKKETGRDIIPTETDVLKYMLWEEQNKKCLYTGREIGITQFIGPNPEYDIEHTIPRSRGGDSTMENLTLCESRFNREIKRTLLPAELPNHADIMARLAPWQEKIQELKRNIDKTRTNPSMDKAKKDKRIQKKHMLRMELAYWQHKYARFTMTEVPEGFSRRQGAGIGLIGKYAGLYLQSVFHSAGDSRRTNVRVIKGVATAEFRKIWGLQDSHESKSRDNHVHHCIDAIVIACISPSAYSSLAHYYRQYEQYEWGEASRPFFPKPWPTFTEDVKAIAGDILVVHNTPDHMPQPAHRRFKTAKGEVVNRQCDTARCSLHEDTFYGAISNKGEVRYVTRKRLSELKGEKDIDKIVDPAVRDIVRAAFREGGTKALEGDVYMNREKGILIRKVRCYRPDIKRPLHISRQRDLSVRDYKQQYHVSNDENYMMAIYEGVVRGKPQRTFALVNNIDATRHFTARHRGEAAAPLVAAHSPEGYPLLCTLKKGQHVLLYENTPDEIRRQDPHDLGRRLYYVTGMSSMTIDKYVYGVIVMKHHQEARKASDLKPKNCNFSNADETLPVIRMYHTQFKALVEGQDFRITPLGDILWLC